MNMRKLFVPIFSNKFFTSYDEAMKYIVDEGMKKECDVISVYISIDGKVYCHDAHTTEPTTEEVTWAAIVTDEARDRYLFFSKEDLAKFLEPLEYACVYEYEKVGDGAMTEKQYYYDRENETVA